MSFSPPPLSSLCRPSLLARPSASLTIRRWISQPSRNTATVASLLDKGKAAEGTDISVNGFVRSVRSQKQHCFVALGDGSTLNPLQALVSTSQAEGLTTGAAVRLTGSWVESPAKGQSHELHVSRVDILGPSDPKTFPIQKKYQTPEYLRTMPHLRPRTAFNSVLLRFRSEAIASLTAFFATRQFIQTHPPVITSSDCEGAGEVFTVASPSCKTPSQPPAEHSQRQQSQSHAGPNSLASSPSPGAATMSAPTRAEGEDEFFRSPKYLTVSSQLHLEALAQAVGSVWTLSPTFRAEKSDTSRHLAEFYMLEAEMSFVDDMEAVMSLTEDMLKHLTRSIFPTRVGQELMRRPKSVPASDVASPEEIERRWKGMMADVKWPRITYTHAIEILKSAHSSGDTIFNRKPVWGEGLQTEHEKYIANTIGKGHLPVFVTNYPQDIKAFYMRPSGTSNTVNASGSGASVAEATSRAFPRATVECFDLLVPEYCEIAGGSMRENRLQELLDAMKVHGIATLPPSSSQTSGTGRPDSASAVPGCLGDGQEEHPLDCASKAKELQRDDGNDYPWYVVLR